MAEQPIAYQLVRSRRKTIALEIRPDGTVLVSENEVAYSLYDVVTILQTQNYEAFQSFVTTHNIENWF